MPTVQKIEHTHRIGLPVFKFVASDLINLGLLAIVVLPGLNRVADFVVAGGNTSQPTAAQTANAAVTYFHSPLPGVSVDAMVAYQPMHGQSFGPETGNMRSYGPHGGVDFDCSIGGCAGADVAAMTGGTVTAIEPIATSANGDSYRLVVLGDDGYEQRYVHVDSIVVDVGDYVNGGQIVAKVSPTDSVSTGPHLDIKIFDPVTGAWVNPQTYIAEGKAKNHEAIAAVNDGNGTLTDEEILCAIGESEGTRNADCTPNHNYWGHTDPGNGASNIGTFSAQQDYATPEEADAAWLGKLRNAEKQIQTEAVSKFGQPLSEAALLTALDLYVQSPAAAGDVIDHLPTHDPSPDQIVSARAQSYINPNTGQLDAPGLGNNMDRVIADQERRVKESLEQLNK